ncbi:MAG: hypothetical protein CALGDGBN_00329 [Pseudomonadales bacterium]|nr:hypothetical protein [Pseudomonadales bacterium]
MPTPELTLSHWVFLAVVVLIFVTIGFRRGVIIPSIAGIIVLGLLSDHADPGALNRVIFAAQVVFRALLNAGTELFPIMLVIATMVAMLNSLKAIGADQLMIAPLQKFMVGPRSAFLVLAIAMYLAAAFFWPTPAVALVGTVLIPVALRVGLPAVAAAVAVNLSGHGMALSADPVIQGATRLTSEAAQIDTNDLLPYTILFSAVCGLVAFAIAGFGIRRDMRSGKLQAAVIEATATPVTADPQHGTTSGARALAIVVPILLIGIVSLMVYRAIFSPATAIRGGDATALLGGTAALLLIASTLTARGIGALDEITTHIREGFYFAIRIFAPMIPIAGFFFLGNPEHAEIVMGEGTPGFLFDVGSYVGAHLDGNVLMMAFGMSAVALLAGVDGSGFSGLPLIGSLAGALAAAGNVDPVVLAALGQVVTIFTGGGTLVAWAFGLAADAGIAGITPAELVRRNFVPVLAGMVTITVLASFMMR